MYTDTHVYVLMGDLRYARSDTTFPNVVDVYR